MKKFIIVLINLIVILFLFIAVELILNIREFTAGNEIKPIQILSQPYRGELLTILKNYYFDFDNAFDNRAPVIKDKAPSVIFMGGSDTYGLHLEEKNTPHVVYSKVSKESAYNYGRPATSVREMLAILRYGLYEPHNPDNVKYIIYTYSPDHKRRLFDDMCKYRYDFKEQDGKLIKKDFIPFIQQLKFVRAIRQFVFYTYNGGVCGDEVQNLFALYLKEINNEIEKKYKFGNKKTKFIILVLDDEPCDSMWEDIVKDTPNLYIVKVKDLLHFDYLHGEWVFDSVGHPSAKFWEVLMPRLYKNINKLK